MGPKRYGSIMVGKYHHPIMGTLPVQSLFYRPYDFPVNYLDSFHFISDISLMAAFISSFKVKIYKILFTFKLVYGCTSFTPEIGVNGTCRTLYFHRFKSG